MHGYEKSVIKSGKYIDVYVEILYNKSVWKYINKSLKLNSAKTEEVIN